MAGERFALKVIGEGKVREKGVLAFILPQALDLVARSSYEVSVCLMEDLPRGSLRLRRRGENIEAQYIPNPNRAPHATPAWVAQVPTLSEQLGKRITCPT